ncbi:hypothetical protein A2763_00430 [Candidatus Kaiserbacteria bacterium RIFCSPHIGHO2_01_FULL_54_36]|uniref:Transposase IS200-like domain-containing protein n=1 Tax=Candidatus Kaiserbacteria bacterium RIFCSPHIGHO2_01_FULL_54_36 TaxID=1798482 RepID=A0A1F6CNB7_9BACT|nr:MAG: hypothetical protein A2763_00430 [Candidatus Kaiserbacteria bacterium RIFCSPHIGHO2_01_FULL_54_36]OGG75292.1 MAG: hypothetical protein A3A41_03285 [Candidatus Kaiserbacteria bacterium RIFCSPLOWO2_01_FULL_54_22]
MLRKTPLVRDEAYHIYNRGAHKYTVFTDDSDYWRFLSLLHLANHTGPVLLREILERKKHRGRFSGEIFSEEADKSLVDLLAYSLMPNHFHLIVKQKGDDGITKFMQKLTVSYSMYFNTKYEHSGVLFQGRFKSNHLDTDPYFKWIFPYVHLNPVSLVEPRWQEKGIADPRHTKEFLRNYGYSSYYDYYVGERPQRAILAYDQTADLLDKEEDIQGMLTAYMKGRVFYWSGV